MSCAVLCATYSVSNRIRIVRVHKRDDILGDHLQLINEAVRSRCVPYDGMYSRAARRGGAMRCGVGRAARRATSKFRRSRHSLGTSRSTARQRQDEHRSSAVRVVAACHLSSTDRFVAELRDSIFYMLTCDRLAAACKAMQMVGTCPVRSGRVRLECDPNVTDRSAGLFSSPLSSSVQQHTP